MSGPVVGHSRPKGSHTSGRDRLLQHMGLTRPDLRVLADERLGQEGSLHKLQQEAGMAELLNIARQVARVKVGAATMGMPIMPDFLIMPEFPPQQEEWEPVHDRRRPAVPHAPSEASKDIRPKNFARPLGDHLVRGALNLMFSSGIQAGLGFAFWIIVARLFAAGDVGKASSLISASGLISYLALFGLNSTLTLFLPTARNKNSLITAAFVTVACAAAIISGFYTLLIPFIAPKLESVVHSVEVVAVFAILTAFAATNLLTDSIFIAARNSSLCALTDGVVGSGSKIIFGVLLAGTGAFGLFSASIAGFAAAAAVSVFLIWRILGWRPSTTNPLKTLKPLFKFSGANYVTNCLNFLPSVIIPIIVLDRLGPTVAGYYFVAFQMASLLYSAVYAVEQSFMAEASQPGANWRVVRKRSRRLAVILFVPGGLILAIAAHWILMIFGSEYSKNGTVALMFLAVAVIPMAALNWSWSVLRLTGSLNALVITGIIYAGSVCGAAYFLAPHGIAAVALAWTIGATIAAVLAGISAARTPSDAIPRTARRPQSSTVAARDRVGQRHGGGPQPVSRVRGSQPRAAYRAPQ